MKQAKKGLARDVSGFGRSRLVASDRPSDWALSHAQGKKIIRAN